MKTIRQFDCVEMKNAIQARLLSRRRGMSQAEFVSDVELSLLKSKDPIGEYWRRIRPKRSSYAPRHAVAGR